MMIMILLLLFLLLLILLLLLLVVTISCTPYPLYFPFLHLFITLYCRFYISSLYTISHNQHFK
ncbi:uncharacterized protein BX664DRAFT_325377 [Halteromyces radiatus]|uniref:uncharacterized protein n=1 Tax=Halteromyces radiatus TaxID=101107 RepID=UPI002220463E|nr:uncharacterized protein BX664DRAFT_325377 [Halteromyces radiatus]KAI8097002.1 hypothetical protein BX664DRAFT_325377 [Halteromyces radiatus]